MTEGGRIIAIGSIRPGYGGTLYAASKTALGGMTRGLACDLGKRNFTANLVPATSDQRPATRFLWSMMCGYFAFR